MSLVDVIIVVLIILGLVRGFMRGLFVEIASLVALIAGLYGAIHFSNYAATFLQEHFEWDEKYINLVSFAITFLIIVFLITLAGRALTKLANFAALGIFNKILGGVFGAIKTALILSVLIIIYEKMSFIEEEVMPSWAEGSSLYEPTKALAPSIFPILIEKGEEVIEEIDENI